MNSKYLFTFHSLKKKYDSFGGSFVLQSKDTSLYKAKYMAVAKQNTHLIVMNLKAYNRIEDRIYKK